MMSTSIYSAFYEFLNLNVYTFLINEEREVWFYRNLDILWNVLRDLPQFKVLDFDFCGKVQRMECTPEISKLFYKKKEFIITAVQPIVKLTKKSVTFKKRYGVSLSNYVSSISKMKVGNEKLKPKYTLFKGYVCELWEQADYDWGYYAKSYHHPKKTVEKREIYFTKKKGVCDSIEITSFRYKDIIEGFAKFFSIPLATKNKLQTNPYFEIQKIRKTAKYAVYSQTFGGEIVGYVVSDGKTAYHDDTLKAAKKGWQKKAALAAEKKEIKAGVRFTAQQLHENFGFCWAGINEFADACGLDTAKSYTKSQLRTAFKKCPERRTLLIKYKTELSKIL